MYFIKRLRQLFSYLCQNAAVLYGLSYVLSTFVEMSYQLKKINTTILVFIYDEMKVDTKLQEKLLNSDSNFILT